MVLSAALFMILAVQSSHDTPPVGGVYCRVEPLWGDTGRERIPLGDFKARADITMSPDGPVIAFRSLMPDNPQILIFRAVAQADAQGVLDFDFDDNWGNQGSGQFRPDGTIHLEVTHPGPSASINIRRNYGSYHLTREACEAWDG